MLRTIVFSVGLLLTVVDLEAMNDEEQLKKEKVITGPSQIIIMRHGEKTKNKKDIHLSKIGHERSAKLPDYLDEFLPTVEGFKELGGIYCQLAHKDSSSIRPFETVALLAKERKMPINSVYDRDEYSLLFQDMFKDSKLVGKASLVCWEHKAIEDMLNNVFNIKIKKWKGSEYNRMIVLHLNPDHSVKKHEEFKQKIKLK